MTGEFKYPKWQREFQELVVELDRTKLDEKIQRFETAVFTRLEELAFDSDHHDERQALDDAAFTVSVLKKEKSE